KLRECSAANAHRQDADATWHGRLARGSWQSSENVRPNAHRQDADATWHGRPARGSWAKLRECSAPNAHWQDADATWHGRPARGSWAKLSNVRPPASAECQAANAFDPDALSSHKNQGGV